jgi:hypothetical protein
MSTQPSNAASAQDAALSAEELEREQAQHLPDREALSLIEPGLGIVDLGGDLQPDTTMPSFDPDDPAPQPLPIDQMP